MAAIYYVETASGSIDLATGAWTPETWTVSKAFTQSRQARRWAARLHRSGHVARIRYASSSAVTVVRVYADAGRTQ